MRIHRRVGQGTVQLRPVHPAHRRTPVKGARTRRRETQVRARPHGRGRLHRAVRNGRRPLKASGFQPRELPLYDEHDARTIGRTPRQRLLPRPLPAGRHRGLAQGAARNHDDIEREVAGRGQARVTDKHQQLATAAGRFRAPQGSVREQGPQCPQGRLPLRRRG